MGEVYNCEAGEVLAAGRQYVSQFWRNLAQGWTEITPSGLRPPQGILAFSGTAFDAKNGKLYVQGGGHADYGGNEVWEFDYENRPSAFVKHYEPDWTSIFSDSGTTPAQKYALLAPHFDNATWPGAVVSGGQPVRPISRHTYSSVVWMPWLNRMTVGGASTYSGMPPVNYWDIWLNSPKDFWFYDPIAKTYEYRGSELLTPAYKTITRFHAHESRQRLYGVGINISNRAVIYEHNPAANTWVTLPSIGPSLTLTGLSMAIDTARDRLVIVKKRSGVTNCVVWSYDLTTGVWSEITTSGTHPTHLNAEAWSVYSAKTDSLLLMRGQSDGLAKLNLATGEWTSTAIVGPNHTQTNGNWFYDRRRQVCIFIHQNGSGFTRVWAYKE